MRRSGIAWITSGTRSGNSNPDDLEEVPGVVRPDREHTWRVGIWLEIDHDCGMIDRVRDRVIADAVLSS